VIKITTSQNIHTLYKVLLDYLKKVISPLAGAPPATLLQAAREVVLKYVEMYL
jgi:hypothetical protein